MSPSKGGEMEPGEHSSVVTAQKESPITHLQNQRDRGLKTHYEGEGRDASVWEQLKGKEDTAGSGRETLGQKWYLCGPWHLSDVPNSPICSGSL